MKTLLAFLVLPFALAATAAADWVIESSVESPQLTSDTVTKIKGDKLRVDIANGPAGPMSSIVDMTTGETMQLMHTQKMVIKTPAAQLKAAMEAAQPKGAKKTAPVVKATGQKEKIGDYDCDIYTWADGARVTTLWVAKDHPQAEAIRALEKQMRSGFFMTASMGPDTSVIPGATLKTEVVTKGFKTTTTITSVKEQNLNAKEFEAPADYQNMQVPDRP